MSFSFSQKTACFVLVAGCIAGGCIRVEPIEVKPIEVNINVRVSIDRELDDFFGDLDAKSKTVKPTPAKNIE